MFDFTEDQINRYSRHIILPQVGGEGQKKLLDSKMLIIGAGGLGSPAGLYLAAAGIGRLGIVDFDLVEESNLQRQIFHYTEDIGKPKVESAKETINALNPDVIVDIYNQRLTSENIIDIISDYDIIIDGCDNYPTRYLLNDACVKTSKTSVHGSILRFEGQATVFKPKEGPCYRCLYPDPPPPGAVPSCQEAGVLGVLPGIIGTVQAIEALKVILGIGNPLIGRLFLYHALAARFREVKIRKDPDCPVCSKERETIELVDYKEFCGVR